MIPETKLVPIESLMPDGKNPNLMSDKQKKALRKNIERYGFLIPIITNKEYVIADGQHRWEIAKEIGMKEVPVIALDVNEVDRRMLRQVLNKLHGEHQLELDAEEFQFVGKFEEKWARIGNAVMPNQMKAIAEILRDNILIPYYKEQAVKVDG